MTNILEELWNGEIDPQESLVGSNPHYKGLQHLQSDRKEALLALLSDEQKEKLEKYCDTTQEMNRLCALDKASPMIGTPESPTLVEMAMQW